MAAVTSQPLAGKVAVVTGANKGVGEAIALALAEAGADLVAVGRTAGEEPGTVGAVVARIRALGRRAEGVVADVRDESGVKRVFDRAVEVFGGLDVLVN